MGGADISCIWKAEGWLYLAIVLDLYSRRVVGWATSDRLAAEALRRAPVARNPALGLVHHSDRGAQDCSVDYQAELRRRGIRRSRSGGDQGRRLHRRLGCAFLISIAESLSFAATASPTLRPTFGARC